MLTTGSYHLEKFLGAREDRVGKVLALQAVNPGSNPWQHIWCPQALPELTPKYT